MDHIGKKVFNISLFSLAVILIACVPTTQYVAIFFESDFEIDSKEFNEIVLTTIGSMPEFKRIEIPNSRKIKNCVYKQVSESDFTLVGVCFEDRKSISLLMSCETRVDKEKPSADVCNKSFEDFKGKLYLNSEKRNLRLKIRSVSEVDLFKDYIKRN